MISDGGGYGNANDGQGYGGKQDFKCACHGYPLGFNLPPIGVEGAAGRCQQAQTGCQAQKDSRSAAGGLNCRGCRSCRVKQGVAQSGNVDRYGRTSLRQSFYGTQAARSAATAGRNAARTADTARAAADAAGTAGRTAAAARTAGTRPNYAAGAVPDGNAGCRSVGVADITGSG